MGDGGDDARAVLRTLQELVAARDLDGLLEFFDGGVLIGTSGDGRDRAGVRRYLEAVVGQPGELRWEWSVAAAPAPRLDSPSRLGGVASTGMPQSPASSRPRLSSSFVRPATSRSVQTSSCIGSTVITTRTPPASGWRSTVVRWS